MITELFVAILNICNGNPGKDFIVFADNDEKLPFQLVITKNRKIIIVKNIQDMIQYFISSFGRVYNTNSNKIKIIPTLQIPKVKGSLNNFINETITQTTSIKQLYYTLI